MVRLVALDTGPLGYLTNPNPSEVKAACLNWLGTLLAGDVRVVLPEIADYELRREYQRRNNRRAERNLDLLAESLFYLPLSTSSMRRAAGLWAQMRQTGRPTAHPKALDGDCILMAQMILEVERLGLKNDEWIIATTDTGDLPGHVPAASGRRLGFEKWPQPGMKTQHRQSFF